MWCRNSFTLWLHNPVSVLGNTPRAVLLNGQPTLRKKGHCYYFIDALYALDVKQNLDVVKEDGVDVAMPKIIYYREAAFAKYRANESEFFIGQINSAGYSASKTKDNYFVCVTGLLAVARVPLFADFLCGT